MYIWNIKKYFVSKVNNFFEFLTYVIHFIVIIFNKFSILLIIKNVTKDFKGE